MTPIAVLPEAPVGAPRPDLTPPLPRFAQIEPIGRCNLACRMCTVNERGDTVSSLSFERFVSLLDQMPQLQELHLQGLGEPMLHPQFFDMIDFAARRGIRVSANTNLTLLTETRARRCVDSGLAHLSVSLDGATAAVYESIRRRASFDKVLRNIDRLMMARHAARSPLGVRLVLVLMRANLAQLRYWVELAHAHGIDELLVQRLSSDLAQPDLPARYIPIRRYVENAELGESDGAAVEKAFEQASEAAAQLGMRLNLPRLQNAAADSAAGSGCRWPWDQLYVTAAGEVLPCCMVATADRATFGNAFAPDGVAPRADRPPDDVRGPSDSHAGDGACDARRAQARARRDDPPPDPPCHDGLSTVWHGEAARRFRTALAGDRPPAVCRGCALYRGAF